MPDIEPTEIFRLLAQGRTLKQAAVALGVERWQVTEALEREKKRLNCLTTYEWMYVLTRRGVVVDPVKRRNLKRRRAYMKKWRKGAAATGEFESG